MYLLSSPSVVNDSSRVTRSLTQSRNTKVVRCVERRCRSHDFYSFTLGLQVIQRDPVKGSFIVVLLRLYLGTRSFYRDGILQRWPRQILSVRPPSLPMPLKKATSLFRSCDRKELNPDPLLPPTSFPPSVVESFLLSVCTFVWLFF